MVSISKGISVNDRKSIEDILQSTGFFYDFEIEIALGLVDDTINYGAENCGYHWMRLDDDNGMVAFANYVKNAFSVHSWDLYWLAILDEYRKKHYGSLLLREAEQRVRSLGGKVLWIETSGRPLYEPTRHFYLKNGYELEATLREFYGPGDPKLVYRKVL